MAFVKFFIGNLIKFVIIQYKCFAMMVDHTFCVYTRPRKHKNLLNKLV